MNYKLITFVLLFLVNVASYAAPIFPQKAKKIAAEYLQQRHLTRGHSDVASALTLVYTRTPKVARGTSSANALYYIFNYGSNNGFVVVSGDDRMTAILGDVEGSGFDLSTSHPSFRWWLDALECTMNQVVKSPSSTLPNYRSVDASIKPFVEPLVNVCWGQGEPYFNNCPIDKFHNQSSRSLVGCSAVALAQVLSKWKYPSRAVGKVDYTTYTHKFHIQENLANYELAWDKLQPRYKKNDDFSDSRQAIADLMYVCGLSIQMDYCSIASGAFVKGNSISAAFGLDPACTDLNRFYFTQAEWDEMIKKELSAGRPVVYNGYSMSAGHAFVCDGYNADGLFHINWGWDGSLNGYFALSELNSAVEHAGEPTDAEGSFNIDQSITIGIQPKYLATTGSKSTLYFFSMLTPENVEMSKSNVEITLTNVGTDSHGFKGYANMGVYDKDNRFIAVIGSDKSIDLKPGYFYEKLTFKGALPASLTNSNYTLRPIFKLGNKSEYQQMVGRKGSPYVSYMNLQVNNAVARVTPPDNSQAKLKIVKVAPWGDKHFAGIKNALEITIHNDGALYNGPIVMTRKDLDKSVRVYDNNIIVNAGEDVVLRIKVQSPEGVDQDKLEVFVSGGDNDSFHTNGFTYLSIGEFTYDLFQPTSGVPHLSLNSFEVVTRDCYFGEKLKLKLNVSNSGGFYKKAIYCFVFPKDGGKSLVSGSVVPILDKGDTKDVEVAVSLDNLKSGTYQVIPYYLDEASKYQALTQKISYFNYKTTLDLFVSNPEGYGTFFSQYAFEVPKFVKCGVVTSADKDNMVIDYRYLTGDIVPASTPIVYKADRLGNKILRLVSDDGKSPSDNILLTKVDEQGNTYAGEGEYWYYKFSLGPDDSTYGFYKQNNEGSPFVLDNGSCYLALPKDQGHPQGYSFSETETGLSCPLLNVNDGDSVIYSISGKLLPSKFEDLPHGVYIVNGKKRVK